MVLKVATPLAFSLPVPSTVEPSLKVTVPVGVPTPGNTTATVEVKMTTCPNAAGLTDDVLKKVRFSNRYTVPEEAVVLIRDGSRRSAS